MYNDATRLSFGLVWSPDTRPSMRGRHWTRVDLTTIPQSTSTQPLSAMYPSHHAMECQIKSWSCHYLELGTDVQTPETLIIRYYQRTPPNQNNSKSNPDGEWYLSLLIQTPKATLKTPGRDRWFSAVSSMFISIKSYSITSRSCARKTVSRRLHLD